MYDWLQHLRAGRRWGTWGRRWSRARWWSRSHFFDTLQPQKKNFFTPPIFFFRDFFTLTCCCRRRRRQRRRRQRRCSRRRDKEAKRDIFLFWAGEKTSPIFFTFYLELNKRRRRRRRRQRRQTKKKKKEKVDRKLLTKFYGSKLLRWEDLDAVDGDADVAVLVVFNDVKKASSLTLSVMTQLRCLKCNSQSFSWNGWRLSLKTLQHRWVGDSCCY